MHKISVILKQQCTCNKPIVSR